MIAHVLEQGQARVGVFAPPGVGFRVVFRIQHPAPVHGLGHAAFRVLIDAQQAFIQDKAFRKGRHVPYVAAQHQGRAEHAPQGELGLVIGVGAGLAQGHVALAVHAHGEHVHIVEAAGAAHAEIVQLAAGDAGKGLEIVLNIAGGAVHMHAQGLHPFPGLVRAPVAGGEQDVPPGGFQGHAHGGVAVFSVGAGGEIAEIVFQVVHAPLREGARVHKFMVEGGGVARAGLHPGAGIHAEFEAQAVHVVRKGLHAVGEFGGVGHQTALFVPFLQAPAVVDHDVIVARVQIALFLHHPGRFPDQFVGNVAAEGVPAVPAHGGSK